MGDLAEIKLTFEDRSGVARFNGETTVAIQVVKRRGFNLIDMAEEVNLSLKQSHKAGQEIASCHPSGNLNDQSSQVASMVGQLEGSVLTAIALVMIVVLTSLGSRGAILVGFAIPTSFCYVLFTWRDGCNNLKYGHVWANFSSRNVSGRRNCSSRICR